MIVDGAESVGDITSQRLGRGTPQEPMPQWRRLVIHDASSGNDVSLEAFEVPSGGLSHAGRLFIFATTDHDHIDVSGTERRHAEFGINECKPSSARVRSVHWLAPAPCTIDGPIFAETRPDA